MSTALETLWRDARMALRKARKTPVASLVVLVSLAVGVGANTALFSVARWLIVGQTPYVHADRAASIELALGDASARIVGPQAALIARHTRAFDRVEGSSFQRVSWRRGTSAVQLSTQIVTPGLPSQMRMTPVAGRGFGGDDGTAHASPVALISERLWRREFGGEAGVFGTALQLNDTAYAIVGVAVPPPVYADVDVWIPRTFEASADWSPALVGWLRPGVSLAQARADMASLAPELSPDRSALLSVRLTSLSTRARENPFGRMLVLFWAASTLVLAIVCANLTSLVLARNLASRREIAVRAALGAGRASILRLLIAESFVLAAMGGVAALFVADWGIRALLALRPRSLSTVYPAALPLDATTMAYGLGVALLSGLVIGGVAALRSARGDIYRAIGRDDAQVQRAVSTRYLFGGTVALQAAMAVVLLVAAGLLISSYRRLTDVRPGFDARNLVEMTVQLDPRKYKDPVARHQFFEDVAARVRAISDVTDVAIATDTPPHGTVLLGPIDTGGGDSSGSLSADASWVYVTSSYFTTLGIPQIEGAPVSDRADARDQVDVSQSFAKRYWPQQSAVGQRFRVRRPNGWGPWWRIVGVVGDVTGRGPRDQKDEVYVPFAASAGATQAIVARARRSPEGLFPTIQAQVWAIDPGVPISDLRTVEAALARSYDEQPFYAALLGLFAGIALALAAAGIFGASAYAASSRRREVGIRVALGARARDVVWLMVRQGVAGPLLGVVAGSIAALLLTRVLESFLYGVSAADPIVYVMSAAALVLVSTLATWIPARRASRVDPIVTLRAE